MASLLAFDLTSQFAPLLEKVPEPYRPLVVPGVSAIVGLIVLRMVIGRVSRALRRRVRRSSIRDWRSTASITWSWTRNGARRPRRSRRPRPSARLAGFKIVRQVEAVFVEGYRSPEEALIALKAEAAERGANGILNVNTDRTAAGRCSASGDAVVVAALQQMRRPAPPAQELPTSVGDAPDSKKAQESETTPPAPPSPPARPSPQPPGDDSPTAG